MANNVAIYLHPNRFTVVRVSIVQDQNGCRVYSGAILRTAAAYFFQLSLIVRFTDNLDFKGSRPRQFAMRNDSTLLGVEGIGLNHRIWLPFCRSFGAATLLRCFPHRFCLWQFLQHLLPTGIEGRVAVQTRHCSTATKYDEENSQSECNGHSGQRSQEKERQQEPSENKGAENEYAA